MDHYNMITIITIIINILCCQNICTLVEGRAHYHKIKGGGPSSTVPSTPSYNSTPQTRPIVPSPVVQPDPYPNPSPYQGGPCIFDVTSFGAIGDGSTDDTAAFRNAWKAACAVESSVILVPSSGKFIVTSTIFSGPCKRGIVFQVNGVLMPPNGPECWPETDSKRQWLVFYKLEEMTLNGTGTIEGNGEQWWELPCKPHRGPNGSTLPGPCDSPAMIRFFISNNIKVSGLRIQNSPQFHIKFDGCDGVLIEKLQINSPQYSPNTDGIHVENSKNVGIYNAMIANGLQGSLMDILPLHHGHSGDQSSRHHNPRAFRKSFDSSKTIPEHSRPNKNIPDSSTMYNSVLEASRLLYAIIHPSSVYKTLLHDSKAFRNHV